MPLIYLAFNSYKQASGFKHSIKLDVLLLDLQYPAIGPIKAPPKHTATSEGHSMHSPGSVIICKE